MTISTYHSFCRHLLLDNTIHTCLGMKGGVIDRPMFLVWGVQNIDKFDDQEIIQETMVNVYTRNNNHDRFT